MYLVILIYLMNLLEDWFLYFWDNIFHTYNNHIDINQLIFMRNNSICFYMIDDIEDTFFPVLLLLLLLLLIYRSYQKAIISNKKYQILTCFFRTLQIWFENLLHSTQKRSKIFQQTSHFSSVLIIKQEWPLDCL